MDPRGDATEAQTPTRLPATIGDRRAALIAESKCKDSGSSARILAYLPVFWHYPLVDLTNPLRSLAPTLEAEVLAVLAGTTAGLTGNRLARLASRGSRQGLMNALDRLVVHGLVVAERVGAATVYQLNRQHLLCDPVLSALSSRRRLVEMLSAQINEWRTSCVHSSLFGSVSRGEAHQASDIDLLVVRSDDVDPDDGDWDRQLRDLERDVRAWTGNRLAILEMTASDLGRAVRNREPIVASLRHDALELTGQHLGRFLFVEA